MIILRKYQQELIDNIRLEMTKYKHILVQSPTGSGKTVIFSYIAKNVSEKNKKVLILTDRIELLLQSEGSINRFGLPVYTITAGERSYNRGYNVYIAMSQTFRRRVSQQYWIDFLKQIDLIIIDETHKQEFNYIFDIDFVRDKYLLGFTATPVRSGKMRQLGLNYDKIVVGPTVPELIKLGYLSEAVYYLDQSIDLSEVPVDYAKGDYQTGAMYKIYNRPELYAGVVENWERHAIGSRTLVFCVNIEHAIRTTLEFRKAGYLAKFLVSVPAKPKIPK